MKQNKEIASQVKRLLKRMDEVNPESKEFGYCAEHLDKLLSCKESKGNAINPNTVIICAANLIGVLACIFREETYAMTSKAFSLLVKPKI